MLRLQMELDRQKIMYDKALVLREELKKRQSEFDAETYLHTLIDSENEAGDIYLDAPVEPFEKRREEERLKQQLLLDELDRNVKGSKGLPPSHPSTYTSSRIP